MRKKPISFVVSPLENNLIEQVAKEQKISKTDFLRFGMLMMFVKYLPKDDVTIESLRFTLKRLVKEVLEEELHN